MTICDLQGKYTIAMHGNGCYKGQKKTNSLEAFHYWYKQGVRVFEIDLAKASDGKYVALTHFMNKKDLARREIFDLPQAYTATWFMNQKLHTKTIKGGLTPLSLESIIEIIKNMRDVIIMLDTSGMKEKEEPQHFAMQLSETIGNDNEVYDRLLVEAYTENMLTEFVNTEARLVPIFCVHDVNYPQASLSYDKLLSLGIKFISYPLFFSKKYPDELWRFHENGFIVFSLSGTNIHSKKKAKMGIDVNIVDYYFHGISVPLQLLRWLWGYIVRRRQRRLVNQYTSQHIEE